MKTITVINAKGGCGKSTIAMSLAAGLALRGQRILLMDLDPQAQVTQWLSAGDGLRPEGTLVSALTGRQNLSDVIQPTGYANISFVASSAGLEDLGREISANEGYPTMLTELLAREGVGDLFDFLVIDSPNQISPIMENAIFPADLFIVPFESTKAVKSYGNVFKLILNLRGDEPLTLHVLSNINLKGVHNRVVQLMQADNIRLAETEIRPCGWLAQVDEHGGSIFDYRPHSKGAHDFNLLRAEVLRVLGHPCLVIETEPRELLVANN